MLGRDKLAARITQRLGIRAGETTADQKFTLLPIVCLGACDHAPALMIGETLHGNVDAARLDQLLETA
jgi:NADH-quinone oxidoreductase subunit E